MADQLEIALTHQVVNVPLAPGEKIGNVLKGRPQAKRLTNVKKSPSPLMGEGWGEGEKIDVCQSVISPSP